MPFSFRGPIAATLLAGTSFSAQAATTPIDTETNSFLSTLPIALPFAFIAEPHRALRVSNGIALGMLFLGGYLLARHSGHRPWVGGILTLGVGVVLVWATIALGG